MCHIIGTSPLVILLSVNALILSNRVPMGSTIRYNSHSSSSPRMIRLYSLAKKRQKAEFSQPIQRAEETEDLNKDEEEDDLTAQDSGNQHIPNTGVSLGDEIMESQATKFYTELVPWPISDPGLAKIVTTPPFQPTRYFVPLYSQETLQSRPHLSPSFVLVDIPPFSQELVSQISSFIRSNSTSSSSSSSVGQLVAILVTSKDAIHYDQSPAVYVTRKSDVKKWKDAFPGAQLIMYRLDIPRDFMGTVTQKLDGYGPWAWQQHEKGDDSPGSFVETGRPLRRLEWNETIKNKVLDQGESPPDDLENEDATLDTQDTENDPASRLYTPEAIRKREIDKLILAIYTPGHTYGSVTYIFPDSKICCSGYTLPLEDTRSTSVNAMGSAGPMLDYRGFLSTNKASIKRQVESGQHVIDKYSDRFHTILPSMGKALFLRDQTVDERRWLLRDSLDEWQELGRIYEDLGIL